MAKVTRTVNGRPEFHGLEGLPSIFKLHCPKKIILCCQQHVYGMCPLLALAYVFSTVSGKRRCLLLGEY